MAPSIGLVEKLSKMTSILEIRNTTGISNNFKYRRIGTFPIIKVITVMMQNMNMDVRTF
jgi:hypothetical protein